MNRPGWRWWMVGAVLIAATTVAVGCLPGCAALVFWWFPPAVIAGLVSIAIVGSAAADAARSHKLA